MRKLYPVVTPEGAEVLPTANATLYTQDMADKYLDDTTQVYIEFFSDAAGTIPVTPTAGTIAISATPMGNNYLTAPNTQTVNATDCGTPNSAYTPPIFSGRVARGRAVLSGITGAAYARITFWRYGDS